MSEEARKSMSRALEIIADCRRRKCVGCSLDIAAKQTVDFIIAEFSAPFRAAEAGA